jgi:hypothetical protein
MAIVDGFGEGPCLRTCRWRSAHDHFCTDPTDCDVVKVELYRSSNCKVHDSTKLRSCVSYRPVPVLNMPRAADFFVPARRTDEKTGVNFTVFWYLRNGSATRVRTGISTVEGCFRAILTFIVCLLEFASDMIVLTTVTSFDCAR